jgi:phosphatidylinositol glycan class N
VFVDPDNTRTPLIAWGRGIRGPLPDSIPSSHDDYSYPWQLNNFLRRDVEQADLAPLMAALLGIDYPVNSVGVLPDVDPTRPGYLLPREGESALARLALANAESILEHYLVKHGAPCN